MAGGGGHAQVHCRGGWGVCPVMRDHLHTCEKSTGAAVISTHFPALPLALLPLRFREQKVVYKLT